MRNGRHRLWAAFGLLIPFAIYGAEVEWRAALPAGPGGSGRAPYFTNAMQTGNGDYLIQGRGDSEEVLMRLDPHGKQRWLNRTSHAGSASMSSPYSMRETGNGIVAFWDLWRKDGYTDVEEISAVRYDDSGRIAARKSVQDMAVFEPGLYDFTSRGDVLLMRSENQVLLAKKLSLRGGADWAVVLRPGTKLDAVGVHELGGDKYLFVSNQMGSQAEAGDTLHLQALDSSGAPAWSSDIPTGRKREAYASGHGILWSHLAHAADGRIVIGAIAERYNGAYVEEEDSLILAVTSPTGVLAWMKRFPIARSGNPNFWSLERLAASPAGKIEVRVACYNFSDDLEIDWNGSLAGSAESSSPNTGGGKVRLGNGLYASWGSSQDSLVHAPVTDTHLVATGIMYASLFVMEHPGDREWKTVRLRDYSDTVYSYKYAIPGDESGARIWSTGGQGLGFLLPTADGGALVGGALRERRMQDTLVFAALKLAPGFAVGITAFRSRVAPLLNRKASGTRYDLLGRPRGKASAAGGIYLPRTRP
jgi:hypothetical protein